MKRKSPVYTDNLTCQRCGATTARKAAMQKYCEDCSRATDVERKAKWAKANPPVRTAEQNKAGRERQRGRSLERGAEINRSTVESIAHFPEVDLQWLIKIAVPFTYSASKNHIWATTRKGHVYRRTESSDFQNGIILMLKARFSETRIYRNKIWLDIFVQKPDHRGDAINALDLVADAVKEAIGIDDRWFSIRRLDWQIVKENPRIFIGIGQEDLFDAKLCSYCGRILPEEDFGKSKRECRECTSEKMFLRRKGK